MIHKTKKKRDGLTAKDFCSLWRKEYSEKYRKPFFINWCKDTARFKQLLAVYKPRLLKRIVEFAFSNRKETEFLQSTGYSVAAFVSQVNSFSVSLDNDSRGEGFNEGLPYYEDNRFSLLVTSITHSDLCFLVKHLSIKDFQPLWKELISKSKQAGDREFTKQARLCFSAWIKGEKFLRTHIIRKR